MMRNQVGKEAEREEDAEEAWRAAEGVDRAWRRACMLCALGTALARDRRGAFGEVVDQPYFLTARLAFRDVLVLLDAKDVARPCVGERRPEGLPAQRANKLEFFRWNTSTYPTVRCCSWERLESHRFWFFFPPLESNFLGSGGIRTRVDYVQDGD